VRSWGALAGTKRHRCRRARADNGQVTTAVDSRRYLSVGEAAHELRVSKASVYRAIESGNLPAVRLQPLGSLRIPADALEPERRSEAGR
jgi:excisionase family DNA binding protein